MLSEVVFPDFLAEIATKEVFSEVFATESATKLPTKIWGAVLGEIGCLGGRFRISRNAK